MISSFDVFDTTISRFYGAPEDLHWHLGQILVEAGLVKDVGCFFNARQNAERLAWQEVFYKNGISISQIYRHVAVELGWNEAELDLALREEVRLETETARPIPDMLDEIRTSRNSGRKVCFISDMHLAGTHIKTILSNLDIKKQGEIVFASSDVWETKRSGRLFKFMLESFSASPRDVFHVGDHVKGDFRVPRRLGIGARLYTRGQNNAYEQSLLAAVESHDWRMRSLAAVSKFARLDRLQSEPRSDVRDLLASTIAPFIAGYASWLIAKALAMGVKKLFFMARDMQIVHEIATQLVRSKGLDLQCIYLHASRAAWQASSYEGANDFELSWLCDHLPDARMENVMRRLVSEADIEKIKSWKFDLNQNANDRRLLKELLETDSIKSLIQKETLKKREVLLGYLEQCGYEPNGSCALVDTGWRGTLQKCLSRTYSLAGVSSPQVLGLYIGLRHQVEPEAGSEMIAYLPDEFVGKHGYSIAALLETFLTANHGTTIGYEIAEGGRIIPVHAPQPADAILQQWSLIKDSCLTYVRYLEISPAFHGDLAAVAKILIPPFLAFHSHPLPRDAKLLANWLFDAGRDGPKIKKIASPLSFTEILKLLVYRIKGTSMADTYLSSPWLQGSIAASPFYFRWLAEALEAKD